MMEIVINRRQITISQCLSIFRCLLAILVLMVVAVGAMAETRIVTSSDHFKTGFPLVGAHLDVNCQNCHVRGSFKNTPTKCASCHNDAIALGKSKNHIPTAESCTTCHNPDSKTWQFSGDFDHSGVTGNCVSCHNGIKAEGKSRNHIKTSEKCDACHASTQRWVPVLRVNHVEVKGTCSSCHNNRSAQGKSTKHIQTSQECNVCHKSTTDWSAAGFDHQGVTGNCASCHGVTAQGKNATHIKTSVKCETCHVSTKNWSPVARVDHTQVQGTCSSCHNGRTAQGKSSDHIPTTKECSSCHTTNNWAATFDHAGVTGNCISCHNGVKATGKGTKHIATSDKCEACHAIGGWSPTSTVDHTQVRGTCSTCHDGKIATGKSITHIPTTAECSTCHTSTTDWAVVTFSHTGIIDKCVTCHNNKSTQGKGPTHLATTDKCEACHGVSDWNLIRTVDHAQVQGACSSCHNNKVASGKSATHVATTQECDVCHRSTADWLTNLTFAHSGITTNCISCHAVGSKFGGKSATHIASTDRCEACHSVTDWVTISSVDHTQVRGTCSSCHAALKASTHIPVPAGLGCDACHVTNVWTPASKFTHALVTASRCDACHNGSFISSGALAKNITHVATPVGADCGTCHLSTISFTTNVVFDHAAISGNCASCHASDKPVAKHIPIPAGTDCGVCHGKPPATWTVATLFNHSQVSAQRCDVCHNGAFIASGALGKNAGHVITPAGSDCGLCHKSTLSFVANVVFDHTAVTGNCASCHVTDKPATTHIPVPAGTDCGACHGKPPATWTVATLFNHSLVSTLSCNACHNGSFGSQGALGKPATHILSTNSCDKCHRTTAWTNIILPLDHTQVQGTCNTCHLSDKTLTHIPVPAGSDCGLCHSNPPAVWSPATRFNHGLVSTLRCDACHNGKFPVAISAGATHVPIPPGTDCGACHGSTAAFNVQVAVNHANITGNCASCHAPDKPATHLPVPAGSDCGLCHGKPPQTFTTATLFNHSLVATMRCDACHSGSFAGAGATAKSASHIPTPAGADCGTCHRIPPQTFASASLFNHSNVSAIKCAACHNGSFTAAGAAGKSASHIPYPTSLDCGACHRTPPESFVLATLFNHNLVTSMACNQCHNGSFAASGAVGVPAGHFVTTLDCKSCHAPTLWATVKYLHSSPNYPGDHNPTVTCLACHTSNTQVATWRSVALKPFCAGCHQNNFDPAEHRKIVTPPTNYTAVELKDCTGACHVYTDATLSVIATRKNGPEHRPSDPSF